MEHAATINLKPDLEVFADGVKCAHGATVGELSRDALFYLSARGVPPLDARALLTRAFIARSEEHTSELQSLMRISYAVFCLKKKTNKEHNDTATTSTEPTAKSICTTISTYVTHTTT